MRMRKNRSCSSLLPSYRVNVSYQKKKIADSNRGRGWDSKSGFLQEPQSCPVFCLIDWWTENELCWEVAPLFILASKYSRKKKYKQNETKVKRGFDIEIQIFMYPSPFAVRCGGGKKVANLMFAIVLVLSPVLVEARIPSEKHFLFRIIIFGFIGTGSAENIKHHLKERESQWLKSFN